MFSVGDLARTRHLMNSLTPNPPEPMHWQGEGSRCKIVHVFGGQLAIEFEDGFYHPQVDSNWLVPISALEQLAEAANEVC